MGCDGGTIPRRDELVRVKKKAETKDKESELNFQWRCCSITQQVLQEPVVTCHLGKLFNKMSLIEALLNKETLPDSARHIKNLKDVLDLKLTKNPSFSNEKSTDSSSAPYMCPISGLEMSGKFRFVALWTCGCVLSERALKEMAAKLCINCQKPFGENDVVVLNGNEIDLVLMKTNMEIRQQQQKRNKEKRNKAKAESTVTSNEEMIASSSSQVSKQIKNNSVDKTSTTSALTSQKRLGSLKEADERVKKLKPDYSVSKDPNVSDVYKSIFTSHKSEKEQNRAHWVTYNPFYN